jgi:aerobic carbon-monoxide dehydrogenase large subunit
VSILGNRVLRTEDPRLLTEGGVYVADLRDPRLDGAAYATYVRSTVAHADIAGVDVADALASPGVIDVVTGDDVDLTPIPGMLQADMARPYLARGRVRFAGEPVAVVLS